MPVIDEFSVSLLLYLYDNPNSTTTDVAKAILDGGVTVDELRAMDRKIRKRLGSLEDDDIIVKKAGKPALYSVNHSLVTIGHEATWTFFEGKPPGANGNNGSKPRKISLPVGDFMAVKISDESMIIRLIDE